MGVHAGQPPRIPAEGLAGLLHWRAPGAPFRQARVEGRGLPRRQEGGGVRRGHGPHGRARPELNAALAELEGLIYSEDFCTEGGLSLDDIDLWSRLRSVTLVKGAQFGPKTTAYLKNLEAKGDVPLYFSLAC